MPRFFERDNDPAKLQAPRVATREKFTPPLQRGPSPFSSFRNFSLAGLPIFQRPDVGTEPSPVPQVSRGEAQRMATNRLALADPGEFGRRFPVGTSLSNDPNQEQFTGSFDDLRLPVFRQPGSAPTSEPFQFPGAQPTPTPTQTLTPTQSNAAGISEGDGRLEAFLARLGLSRSTFSDLYGFDPSSLRFPPGMTFEKFITDLSLGIN